MEEAALVISCVFLKKEVVLHKTTIPFPSHLLGSLKDALLKEQGRQSLLLHLSNRPHPYLPPPVNMQLTATVQR